MRRGTLFAEVGTSAYSKKPGRRWYHLLHCVSWSFILPALIRYTADHLSRHLCTCLFKICKAHSHLQSNNHSQRHRDADDVRKEPSFCQPRPPDYHRLFIFLGKPLGLFFPTTNLVDLRVSRARD